MPWTTVIHTHAEKRWAKDQIRIHGPGAVLGRPELTIADAFQIIDDMKSEFVPVGECDNRDENGVCRGHRRYTEPTAPACAEELLSARTSAELDDAFGRIFDIVHAARKTGEFEDLDALLEWLGESSVTRRLEIDILLAAVRLSFHLREHLGHWDQALKAVKGLLEERGEKNVAALLHGLENVEGTS